MPATHEVVNQSPPLQGHDVLATDVALVEALHRHGGAAHAERLHALGRLAGNAGAHAWGRDANTSLPVLRTHDRYGHRIDEVEFHPSWHHLMDVATSNGLHGTPWTQPLETGAHVARAVGFHTWFQVEAGHGCPISMTYAAVPALRTDDRLAAEWVPRLAATGYEFGLRDPAAKTGSIAGMAMTEKQGGSDVRANTTRAVPTREPGVYALTGHKWFCSAPMSDVFLVLAQAPGGLTCFVLPRVLPDGSRNTFLIQRLKDKLGNRSNASSEIELDGTLAWRLGDEGRGVATIISMVAATRLDCVIGSAGLLRAAVAQATWHAAHRSAFGALLVDQPAMTAVLADLALESEAATALAIRLAATFDTDDAGEAALRRIALPPSKYWVTKRAVAAVGEALECLGGNGYAEESGMPRLYREAPVNAVWEGSGNVQALDLLRVLTREPSAVEALRKELALASGTHAEYDRAVADLDALLGEVARDPVTAQRQARRLAGRIATLLQASLLLRFSPAAVSEAFVASRVADDNAAGLGLLGALPGHVDVAGVVDRATPHPANGG
jgi:putative acyl-CoA dehydrogenase